MAKEKDTKKKTTKKEMKVVDKIKDIKDEIEEKVEDIKEDVAEEIEDMSEEISEITNEIPTWGKMLIVLIPVILIIIGLLTLATYKNKPQDMKITTSTLKEVIEIDQLSTIEYNYKATATKYKSNGKTEKYHVAYEGTVKAGINYEDVKFEIDEENKVIKITLPEITIFETIVNTNKDRMKFMFMKDKYETEDIIKEAIKLCQKDLESRVKKDEFFQKTTKENAVEYFEGLYKNWIETVDDRYTVVIE